MKPYPEMPPGLTLARDGEVLTLSLSRPARRNSLTDPIVYALTDTMDAVRVIGTFSSRETSQAAPAGRIAR